MTMDASAARILVATEIIGDAEMVRGQLRSEFPRVAVSTDPAFAVADFESFAPDVLVLAFNTLAKSDHYYEILVKHGIGHTHPHRTLVLCTRWELREAYERCKQGRYDNYVLFWPVTHDAPRLLLAVHHALQMHVEEPSSPMVLYVDDDPFQHSVIKAMLAGEKLRLVCVPSAAEAFKVLGKELPDLILMDINLPEIDGVEATRRIKARHEYAQVPILMVTGLGTRDMVVESLRAGAVEFVVKPVNREILVEKVRRLVRAAS